MGCTHLDVEEIIEKSSGIIEKIEKLNNSKELGCFICKNTFSAEICLDCNNIYCRELGHIEVHWKESWHKNYFVYTFGTVSCEECTEYIRISNILKMVKNNSGNDFCFRNYKHLNLNWVKGFLNLKRTCYMSSLLQSILSIKVFIINLLNMEHNVKNCKIFNCIFCALNRILYQMYNNSNGYVDISELIKIFWYFNPSFAKSEYQDVQEFFIFLSSQLHNFDSGCNDEKVCLIHKTFGGLFNSIIKCNSCNKKSHTFESFTTISMDLFGSSLTDTINKYFSEETVSINRECECGNIKNFTKTVKIEKEPEILFLNLKRYQLKNKNILKIENIISYPEVLTVNNKIFELSSIIMHSGEIDSGHYIAYTKRESQWYLTNDEEIIRVPLSDVLNKPVYILFYVQVESELLDKTRRGTAHDKSEVVSKVVNEL